MLNSFKLSCRVDKLHQCKGVDCKRVVFCHVVEFHLGGFATKGATKYISHVNTIVYFIFFMYLEGYTENSFTLDLT